MKYVVIGWKTEDEFVSGEKGTIIGWRGSLAMSLHLANHLMQQQGWFKVIAAKVC